MIPSTVIALAIGASGASELTAVDGRDPAAMAGLVWVVVGVSGAGVWATDLDRVETTLRPVMASVLAGRLQQRAATGALLAEARGAGLICDVHEPPCVAKLGVAAGADRVAVLDVAADGELLRVSLRVIDVAAEDLIGQAARTVTAAAPERAALVDLVDELLLPSRFFGALELVSAPAGTRVFLDGAERGTSPLGAPLGDLTPGDHVVEVRNQTASWSAPFQVRRGEVTTVAVVFPTSSIAVVPATVSPMPPKPSSVPESVPAGLMLLLGGGTLAGVAGIAAVALAVWLESPIDNELRQGVRVAGTALAGGAVVGAVAAGVGTAWWLSDDHDDGG